MYNIGPRWRYRFTLRGHLLELDEHEGVKGDEEDEGPDAVEDEVQPDAVDRVVLTTIS